MYNKLTIIGRIGRDIEAKETNRGIKYWKFSVATNEWISSKSEEESTWHSITCWNTFIGKTLENTCGKGTLVYIEGKQTYNTYTNKDGVEMKAGNLVLNSFSSTLKVLDKGHNRDSGLSPAQAGEKIADAFDDEVPF